MLISFSDFAGLLKDHAVAVLYVLTTRSSTRPSHTTSMDSTGTGAREVHGAILRTYVRHRDSAGVLGFPTSDERPTADGVGAYSRFQRGSIYWTSATGAHEVHGAIHRTWAGLGYERGDLG